MKKIIIAIAFAAAMLCSCCNEQGNIPANKKEVMDQFLAGTLDPSYVPAAFFVHFPGPKFGVEAVRSHLDFFVKGNSDILKVQFEQSVPKYTDLDKQETWDSMAPLPEDFYRPTLELIQSIYEIAGRDVYVLPTLYSAFQVTTSSIGEQGVREGAANHPEDLKRLIGYYVDALNWLVDECKKIGIEGFYMCCQGGELKFDDIPGFFEEYVKPFDLAVIDECVKDTKMNILHICDWEGAYGNLERYADYPGQIVNTPIDVDGETFTLNDGVELFKRPVLGGLERKGIINTGTTDEIAAVVKKAIEDGPAGRMMIGAECTVGSAPFDNVHAAILAAHHGNR